MKKIITLLVTLILSMSCVFGLTACGDKEVVGVDMYLMQLVAEELNMKLEINDVDFDGICGKVATEDNAVGAAGITITDDRKEQVAFSDAYYSSVQCIISNSSDAFTQLSQLAGKKIGVQKGTTGCTMVTEAIESGDLKNTNAEVKEYDTGAVAFTALKAGQIDYIVLDELPSQKLVNGQTDYISKKIDGVKVEKYGYCVGKNASKKAEIIAAMNKVIAEVNMDEIVEYYTALSKDEKSTISLKQVDLSDNTNGTLKVYTCSGFEPYEFVVD